MQDSYLKVRELSVKIYHLCANDHYRMYKKMTMSFPNVPLSESR